VASFVQQTSIYAASGPCVATYGSNVTTGNLLIAAVGTAFTTTLSGTVLSDNQTNTWTLAPIITGGAGSNFYDASLGYSTAIYYTTANANSGGTTPTVTYAPPIASNGFSRLFIWEFNGPTAVDQAANATNTTGFTATAGPVTTTSANEVAFAFPIFNSGNPSAGGSYNAGTIANLELTEYEILSSAGSYSATAASTASDKWMIQMVTFFGSAPQPGNPTIETPILSSAMFFA
jgi:hypothetical protein